MSFPPVPVSSGIVSILFPVADTVLWFWFRVRKILVTHWCFSSCWVLLSLKSRAFQFPVFASRSTRSGREHGWDRWSSHFYKLSTGLAATKVNPVLGIIGKNIENKTEKNPPTIIVLTQFWGPKVLLLYFWGAKRDQYLRSAEGDY